MIMTMNHVYLESDTERKQTHKSITNNKRVETTIESLTYVNCVVRLVIVI